MLDLSPIVEIVRRSREYGHAHFRVAPDVWAECRRDVPVDPAPRWTKAGAPSMTRNPMAQLMGIPTVVDRTLPDGGWQLVDNSTKAVIKGGVLRHDPEEKTDA